MAVTAKKLDNRDVYETEYGGAENRDGGIVARFTSENDESDYKGLDDGKFVVTFQAGQSGEADVVIEDVAGEEIDSGTVQFG